MGYGRLGGKGRYERGSGLKDAGVKVKTVKHEEAQRSEYNLEKLSGVKASRTQFNKQPITSHQERQTSSDGIQSLKNKQEKKACCNKYTLHYTIMHFKRGNISALC